ncbi:MAG: DUF5071 domain-containing protein [Burkholderiales bacterium]
MLPRNKDDAERAMALVALGYPAIAPVLPQMLDWLKTIDSPVESVMRECFVTLGEHAVPVVQKGLHSRNDLLKYAIVTHVVTRWPPSAVAALRQELLGLATGAMGYGTDIVALKLLIEHRLAERDWLRQWSQFKVKRLREFLSSAEEADRLLDDWD